MNRAFTPVPVVLSTPESTRRSAPCILFIPIVAVYIIRLRVVYRHRHRLEDFEETTPIRLSGTVNRNS